MESNNDLSEKQYWKDVIKKHQSAFIVLIVAGVCVIVGAFLVLFWVIEINPFVNPRTGTFDDWTLNYIVGITILTILSELLFVGIPTGIFFVLGGYLYWRKLPEEEKQEFKDREKKKTHRKKEYGGGGGFSFFMFIAYCIYIAVDGNYNATFGSQPFSYWIYSWLLTLMWIFIVFGIPIGILLISYYIYKWRKK
ncbi:MAG: hypothetical protein CEE43_00640 [Promethearchaeota archaeon Loki_b32]|nr:MAG: hypothetical protein CEE43_00640 [Candidatus Lokiarchaeota archaeon Loki_b32]